MIKTITLILCSILLASLVGCAQPQTVIETVVVEKPVVETVIVEVEGEKVVETVIVEVTPQAPEPAEKTKLTVWMPDADRWMCLDEKLISEFNTQSSTVEVEVSHKPNYDESAPARAAIVGGVGPDIFLTSGGEAAEMADAGYLLPLDDLAEQFGWQDLFASWALETGRMADGKLYTIQSELETLVLFYNKTLFEEKGWEVPDTIDDLQALAETMQADGITPFGGIGLTCVGCSRWYTGEFFNSVAGPEMVYQALKGEIPWTDPAFVESIALLNDWVQNGWFMGSPEEFLATDWDTMDTAFSTREVATNIEGTWFQGRYADFWGPDSGNPDELGWAPMPTTSGEDIFTVGLGSSWSVNAAVANPQAVGEYLNWYFSPEIQGRQFGECGTNPAPVPVTAEMMAGVDPLYADIYAAFNQAMAEGNYGYTIWSFWPPKTNTFAKEEIQKVWTGDMTPEEYMAGFDAVFAEELAAGEVPAIPER